MRPQSVLYQKREVEDASIVLLPIPTHCPRSNEGRGGRMRSSGLIPQFLSESSRHSRD